MPSTSTEHERSQPLPLTGPGTLHNGAVNVIRGDPVPVTLSLPHTELLTLGMRFIPRSSLLAPRSTLEGALSRFGHRLAVAMTSNAFTGPQRVGGSLLPLRLPPATTLQRPQGPVGAAVLSHRAAILAARETLELSMGRPSPSNLSVSAYRTLRRLSKRTDIVVRPADKNLGVTVMSKEWYVAAALKHLSDAESYANLGYVSADQVEAKVKALLVTLQSLLRGAGVQVGSLGRLLAGPFRLARFYVLPKLHKHDASPLDARPITSQSGSPTEVASIMLAGFLNQIIGVNHWWALRDTTALVNHIEEEVILPPDDPATGRTCWLISADVAALYPNMDVNLMKVVVYEAVDAFLRVCVGGSGPLPCTAAQATATMRLVQVLLPFVLDNCVFTFDAGDGKGAVMYRQRRGAAMGAACVPPIANLYMASVVAPAVKHWKAKGGGGPRLVTAKGFIDDVFGVFFGTQPEAANFMAVLGRLHRSVRLTSVFSTESVPFLDLEVYRTPGASKLSVRPYVKALNRFLYIPPWSGHAPHMLGSFVSGEVRRFIRNSSQESDAVAASTMLMAHLLDRGYHAEFVLREFSRVCYSSRHTLLHPPAKPDTSPKVVALTLPYNPITARLPLGNLIRGVQETLELCHEQVKVTLGWTNERNLQSLLHLQWPKAELPAVTP